MAARLGLLALADLLVFPLRMLPLGLRSLAHRAHRADLCEHGLEVYRGGATDGPLVLYVHGGSWGQGSPWQYALLTKPLLAAGASAVAIVKYRLFPEAEVDEMLADVQRALEWARAQPGTPRVVLAGQSAGAHLCALLLARVSCTAAACPEAARQPPAWLPDRFVSLSAPLDILAHFRHETTRGVHWASPMWLAMIGRRPSGRADDGGGGGGRGGEERAEAAVLALVLERLGASDSGAGRTLLESPGAAERCGLDEASLLDAAEVAGGTSRRGEWSVRELAALALASPARLLRLQNELVGAGQPPVAWPPTAVIHAADDLTVPVSSGRDFAKAAGGAVQWREYQSGGHAGVVLALMSRTRLDSHPPELARMAADFVRWAALREAVE